MTFNLTFVILFTIMKTAKTVQDLYAINRIETLPNGVKVLILSVADFNEFKQLPQALEYEFQVYGKSAWNSDRNECYFRTDKRLARTV